MHGDRRALGCIVANLIDNALRAEPEKGTVQVRVKPGATIEVIDHGEGVTPEDRERIFEPFWRKSEATAGTGLGLAIVKDLVEAHGGHIVVVDTPGGGATFKVTLKQLHDLKVTLRGANALERQAVTPPGDRGQRFSIS